MNTNLKKLDPSEIIVLKKHFEQFNFPMEFDIVYERQVPLAGMVLLKGGLEFIKGKKSVIKIEPGYILGIHNLLNEVPLRFTWRIKKNSQLLLLTKSELIKMLKDSTSEIFPIIKEFLKKR